MAWYKPDLNGRPLELVATTITKKNTIELKSISRKNQRVDTHPHTYSLERYAKYMTE